MSRHGYFHDNSVVESFFQVLKQRASGKNRCNWGISKGHL
ncbi:MAG: hypothetical protein EBQ70_01830 [Betaproteobacteria bacterium]|nr:hypothetical protein [Betaproteobacteria bacterium]